MEALTLKNLILEGVQYREVFYNLFVADFKLKYKRTFLGMGWSLLNPLLQLTVLSLIFSHIARLEMKNYTLYLFSGLLGWTFFQSSVVSASTAFIESEDFIKKVYLPKMLFPLNKVCQRGLEYLFALSSLSLMGLVLGFDFHPTLVALPLAITSLFLFTLGLSLVAAVLKVYFRDTSYLLGISFQLLYFATPILYPLTLLPERYQYYLSLNPVYIETLLFQKIIYFGTYPTLQEWGTALSLGLFSFLFGCWVLTRTEEDLVFRL